jgi:hypothetical protein
MSEKDPKRSSVSFINALAEAAETLVRASSNLPSGIYRNEVAATQRPLIRQVWIFGSFVCVASYSTIEDEKVNQF